MAISMATQHQIEELEVEQHGSVLLIQIFQTIRRITVLEAQHGIWIIVLTGHLQLLAQQPSLQTMSLVQSLLMLPLMRHPSSMVPNQNYGWLLRKSDETVAGKVDFGSKESGNTPVLIITPQ